MKCEELAKGRKSQKCKNEIRKYIKVSPGLIDARVSLDSTSWSSPKYSLKRLSKRSKEFRKWFKYNGSHMSISSHFYCCYFIDFKCLGREYVTNSPTSKNQDKQPVLRMSSFCSWAGIFSMRLFGFAKCGTIDWFRILTHLCGSFYRVTVSSMSLVIGKYFGSSRVFNWPVHKSFKTTWAQLPLEFSQGFSAFVHCLVFRPLRQPLITPVQ